MKSDKPNLLCIGRSLSGGGAERVQIDLLAKLKSDFSVNVVYLSNDITLEDVFPADIKKEILEIGNKYGLVTSFFNVLRVMKLAKRSDILFAMQDTTPIYLGVIAKIFSRKPLVGWVHNTWSGKKTSLNRIHGFLTKAFYPFCDQIVAVSDGAANDLVKHIRKLIQKTEVICNPVDGEKLKIMSESDIEEKYRLIFDRDVIISAGRLESVKGYDILINAFAMSKSSKKCNLLIIGEGSQRKELEELVTHLGLESSVHMPGFVRNPYALMVKSKLFVLSSYYEGLPTVLIEAQILKCPIISTDCPSGPNEILDHGRVGFLTDVGDISKLSTVIDMVIGNYDVAIEKAKSGAQLVGRYNPDNVAGHFKRVLNSNLREPGKDCLK